MKKSRRREFSVASSLQYRFLAMSLIYSFVIVCFFSITVFGPDIIKMNDQSISLESRGEAANRILAKHSWAWLAIFLLVIMLGLHSFREFKKVAGPLYRFRWAFRQMERGCVIYPVKIRKKDYLREDVTTLNEMLGSFLRRLQDINQATEDLLKSTDELESALKTGSEKNESQIALVQTYRERLEKLSSAVNYYRLKDQEQEMSSSGHDAVERQVGLLGEKEYG